MPSRRTKSAYSNRRFIAGWENYEGGNESVLLVVDAMEYAADFTERPGMFDEKVHRTVLLFVFTQGLFVYQELKRSIERRSSGDVPLPQRITPSLF